MMTGFASSERHEVQANRINLTALSRIPRGFTLVEILVVIVIVGIMAGLAVISIGGNPQRELQQEARRLQLVLRTAGDEALLTGKEYGLIADRHSYQILQFDQSGRQWVAGDNKIFSSYRLPEYIALNLSLEGEAVDLAKIMSPADREQQDDNTTDEAEEAQQAPALIFFSSGEATPFAVEIGRDGSRSVYRLSSDGVQDVQIEQHNG